MTIKRKMKKQTANKLLCLLLAVLLLAGQVLPAVALNQEGGTITTVFPWDQLSRVHWTAGPMERRWC